MNDSNQQVLSPEVLESPEVKAHLEMLNAQGVKYEIIPLAAEPESKNKP